MPKCFNGVINIDIGLSDFHNYISTASKVVAPLQKKRKITYRSMKKFDQNDFQYDINMCPFHVGEVFDDIDDQHWFKEKLFMSTLEKHAPSKVRTVDKNQVPYMNSELRKAINQRNMWRGKHFRCRGNREFRKKYVKLRNKVVKLRNKSIRNYFMTRCNEQSDPRQFFNTVKPFLSNEAHSSNEIIILKENDTVITDPTEVADIFNLYYASIAKYEDDYDGLDMIDYDCVIQKHSTHDSVTNILKCNTSTTPFVFSLITTDQFTKYVNSMKCKKAVGHDGIKALFLKVAGDNSASSLCNLYNSCISSCSFPTSLKMAEISPIFKKKG